MADSVYTVVLSRALRAARGDMSKLAKALGVPVVTLTAWLREDGQPTPAQLRAALDYIAERSKDGP